MCEVVSMYIGRRQVLIDIEYLAIGPVQVIVSSRLTVKVSDRESGIDPNCKCGRE